jgi:hypothetical protein
MRREGGRFPGLKPKSANLIKNVGGENVFGPSIPERISRRRCAPYCRIRNFDTPIVKSGAQAGANQTVPYGTALLGGAAQALRARLRSCCPSGTRYILRAGVLIKLALMG